MKARILIIEDNAENSDLMSYLLAAFGHEPVIAATGEDGLAAAAAKRPDLVICDIHLPGIDGYAVARRMKTDAALREIPLVAVTALAMVGDRERVLAAGFDGYVTKPIDPEAFVPRVEEWLNREPGPRAPAPPPAPAPAVAARTRRSDQKLILVVDDQPVNLSLGRCILEPIGYSVTTTSGIIKALSLARETPPDLIISDVRMNDGNGFDFIREAKADPVLRDVPFLFITSTHCDEESRALALSLGARRFLFRPIEPQMLLAEISACLREGK